MSDIFHIQLFSKFVVTVGAAELLDILDSPKIMKSYMKSKGKHGLLCTSWASWHSKHSYCDNGDFLVFIVASVL